MEEKKQKKIKASGTPAKFSGYPAKLPCPGRGPRRIYSYFYARKSKLIHPK